SLCLAGNFASSATSRRTTLQSTTSFDKPTPSGDGGPVAPTEGDADEKLEQHRDDRENDGTPDCGPEEVVDREVAGDPVEDLEQEGGDHEGEHTEGAHHTRERPHD